MIIGIYFCIILFTISGLIFVKELLEEKKNLQNIKIGYILLITAHIALFLIRRG